MSPTQIWGPAVPRIARVPYLGTVGEAERTLVMTHSKLPRAESLAVIVTLGLGGPFSAASAQFVESVDILQEWTGEAAGDRLGRVIRGLGDVNGDGVNDIALGSPNRAEGGEEAGKMYIYSGADGSLIRCHLGTPWDNFGNEIANVGDVNNDDVSDYVAGAPRLPAGPPAPGRAVLFSGVDGSVIHEWTGEADGDLFGRIVSGAGNVLANGVGDINNDGTPDILIGAPRHDTVGNDAGRVYVYSGADPAVAIHTIDGRFMEEQFGMGIGGLGDLNEDGHDDFIIGAPQGFVGIGRAYVLSGLDAEPLLGTLVPSNTGRAFGTFFVSGPGDINGDGTLDIFVGDVADVTRGAGTGKVYLYSGVNGGTIRTFTGSSGGEGLAVGRGCGDVDGDGRNDVVIAAFSSSEAAVNGGRVFVYSGRNGAILRTITGNVDGEFFGWSTVGIGDIDNDGAIDFAISAAQSNVNGALSGHAYIIAGDIFPCAGDADGDGTVGFSDILTVLGAWGPCDGCFGDLDHDGSVGFADLLIVLGGWGPCPGP